MSRRRKHPAGRRKIACNDCGQCCEPVTLAVGPDMVRANPDLQEAFTADELDWLLNDLTECDPPDWIEPTEMPHAKVTVDGRQVLVPAKFYECARYDPEARRCTRYDERPLVCHGYPWYGNRPDPAAVLPPECEFHRQVGRTPVTIGPRR